MSTLVLRGIEGSNSLGFLAAVGALRLCDLTWPRTGIRMHWLRDGGWRPALSGLPVEEDLALCATLAEQAPWAPLDVFELLGNNLTVPLPVFERVVRDVEAVTRAGERRAADFAVSFGSDVIEDKDKGRIEYTDLCFITGSGHQHFLGTARILAKSTNAEHLREALVGPWRYRDDSFSMRWDPDDAKEYALRWRNPSIGGVQTVWGANRLAFEALPLFPAMPTDKGLKTTGFRSRKRLHDFTWPIWTHPAGVDTVRSLLSLKQLADEAPDRAELRELGVEEVYRVQRVRIGQGANFKVSFRPARAV